MLFSLNYVEDCNLYQFFDVPSYFFREIISKNAFDNSLFPEWFADVIGKSPKFREEFEELAVCIFTKTVAQRKEIYRLFINHNRINSLCINPQVALKVFSEDLLDVEVLACKVFDRLYNSTLQGVTVEKKLGEGIYDHYSKFRLANSSQACPFCGLENYPDRLKNSRSQYDHYLKKSKYFFGAVNFRNLIPMCSVCNEAPNKHSKDIIFSEAGIRREVFYPFGSTSGAAASITNAAASEVGFGGSWNVAVVAQVEDEQNKVATWKSIFNIEERYAARISEEANNWLMDYLYQGELPEDYQDINSWRHSLIAWSNTLNLMNQRKVTRNGIVKSAYFEYLYRDAADSEIVGIRSLAESELLITREIAIG